jgi:hypothetical protein
MTFSHVWRPHSAPRTTTLSQHESCFMHDSPFAWRWARRSRTNTNMSPGSMRDVRRSSPSTGRYRELLLRDGWSPLVAGTLDRSMDELLDLLDDPHTREPWKRRGLVVGDVQSGKTASYSALICKAADAGYRMVVLLAGTLENVRRQTQERLDAAFVGLDSRDFLSRDQLKHKTHVGVGHIDSRRDGIVFTSRDRDFRAAIASALSISLNSVKEPVLVVAKKNKSVLSNLATWLRTMNADKQGHIDLPLLLIDDEADNASINTRLKPDETTAINKAIRDLLTLFTRSSYVGFTVTPFANIFIDPTSTDEMLGDDLFPRDFIHLLEPPTNYIGMDRVFPPVDPEQPGTGDEEAWAAGIRTIDDEDDWLPVDHKQDVIVGPAPDSLLNALRHFFLTCAVRDLRVKDGVNGRDKSIHRSMLVNVSRFTAVQNQVADQLHVQLETIKQQVRRPRGRQRLSTLSVYSEKSSLSIIVGGRKYSTCYTTPLPRSECNLSTRGPEPPALITASLKHHPV